MKRNNPLRKRFVILCAYIVVLSTGLVRAVIIVKPGPSTIPCFDVYEIIVQLDPPPECNPFTDVKVSATFIPTRLQRAGFTPQGGPPEQQKRKSSCELLHPAHPIDGIHRMTGRL